MAMILKNKIAFINGGFVICDYFERSRSHSKGNTVVYERLE